MTTSGLLGWSATSLLVDYFDNMFLASLVLQWQLRYVACLVSVYFSNPDMQ